MKSTKIISTLLICIGILMLKGCGNNAQSTDDGSGADSVDNLLDQSQSSQNPS